MDKREEQYAEEKKTCGYCAEGLSEELMGKANEQMARVNDAWSTIKKERNIK